MNNRMMILVALIVFSLTLNIANAVNIVMYEQIGCHYCAVTESILDEMKNGYNITLVKKEIRYNKTNMNEAIAIWTKYGVPQSDWGTPTILINEKMLIIGALSKDMWITVIENCNAGNCPEQAYFANEVDEDIFIDANGTSFHGGNNITKNITWGALVIAAIGDSINPCTIAVMAMLLATIFIQQDRKKVVIAGMAFTLTIFVCYFLMGLGILKAIESTGLQTGFLGIMTVLAGLMTVLELRAYYHYKPGGLAIEMPMFLRPYAKKILSSATTVPFVVLAALVCSLLLLPCSSGPYLVVLSLLSQAKTYENLAYLTVYNLIFVIPLIIITFVIGFGMSTPEEVREARDKNVKKMHLISGLLMFIVTCLVAYQFIRQLGLC